MTKFKKLLFPLFLIIASNTYLLSIADKNFYEQEHITVIVHGTWFPLISSYFTKMDCPLGITNAKHLQNGTLRRVSKALSRSAPDIFPISSIYVFGWSGALSFKGREQAAKQLYRELSKCKGKITLITHSHGGNVALNLAKIAQKYNKKSKNKFTIERLILLACPVQKATADYISSDIFKKIYSFYSKSDVLQVMDPQKLYCLKLKDNEQVPLFSQRVFASPFVIEVPIYINNSDPSHNKFLSRTFFSKLIKILELTDYQNKISINLSSISHTVHVATKLDSRLAS